MTRTEMAGKLKKAGTPTIATILFIVATMGDVIDFFDNSEDEAQATADQSHDQAWAARWDALEAEGKTEVFAKEATLRIVHLETRLGATEQNIQNMRNFVMQVLLQDRDYRNAPAPPAIKRTKVPKALKKADDGWIEEMPACGGDDPMCVIDINQGEPSTAQQIAPMPSLGELWKEGKDKKKEEFKQKLEKKE